MKTGSLKNNLLLFLAACVWGFGFVAQSSGMEYVGPCTYNACRLLIGSVSLIPLVLVLQRNAKKKNGGEKPAEFDVKKNFKMGFICGIPLFLGIIFQQYGLIWTTAGKAGFITALYMLMLPIFGLFLKKKVEGKVWLCVLIALAGLYLLCMQGGITLQLGDGLILICAVFFAIQMLVVDYVVNECNPVFISAVEFLFAGIFSLIGTFIFENPTWSSIVDCAVPILYGGICSCGVGYTLQTVGQKNAEPTQASLILSLESVMSVVGGWLILRQHMSIRELIGCLVMFAATTIATIPKGYFKRETDNSGSN